MSFESIIERLGAKDPRHLKLLGTGAPHTARPRRTSGVIPQRRPLPCIHEGAVVEWCTTCTGEKSELRHVRDCEIHERCTRGRVNEKTAACSVCPDWKPDYGIIGSPPGTKIIDGLVKGEGNAAFNASITRWKGQLLLAYRTGWAGAQIHIAELDESLRVLNTRTISGLTRGESNYGREDPRLFAHNDCLHLAYIGVQGTKRNNIWTHQCYARLRDDYSVESTYAPKAPGSKDWEKNWGFFSHDGELYAVYTVAPHRILKIVNGVAEWAHETPTHIRWSGGELRGGAPPVRVGDEYWNFIHDRIEIAGLRVYRTGLYTFDAKPPFAIRRYIPEPILTADPLTNPGNYAAVLFTCGAVRDGETWKLSHGMHDRWIEVHEFAQDDLEKRLVSI